MSARIACLKTHQEVVDATEGIQKFDTSKEAEDAVNAYRAHPTKANYEAALKATENVPAERARLEEAKKNIEAATADLNNFDKTDATIAKEAVDAYIARPYKKDLYEAALKATENVPAERARLEEAKKNIENATNGATNLDVSDATVNAANEAVKKYRNHPSKANYEAALEATKNVPTARARLEEAKKNIEGATKNLTEFDKSEAAKAVDAYIKRPYKKSLYDAALKATENDPIQRARLEEAKKNIEGATKDLHKFLKDDSQLKEDSKKAEKKAEKMGDPKKGDDELAKTGVAIGTLTGIAALSTLGGAVALRRRREI